MIIRCCAELSNTFLYVNDTPLENGRHEAMLVDCSADPGVIKRACAEKEADIRYIVLTHGHYDHVTAFEEVRKLLPDAVTFCHSLENKVLTDIDANVSELFGDPKVFPECEKTLEEGDSIVLRGEKTVTFKVLHTPGHTPGCICLLNEDEGIMFTGDTLFANGGVGRTDFKWGSTAVLEKSLRRLSLLDGNITILPGHGGLSTIADELGYF